ncbi:MAG TPA: hypothetical protein VFX70_22920 [Mycobacteriales bacterium]|nr:hypothetical protein [Mycobacteriales bacterium]
MVTGDSLVDGYLLIAYTVVSLVNTSGGDRGPALPTATAPPGRREPVQMIRTASARARPSPPGGGSTAPERSTLRRIGVWDRPVS